MHSAATQRLRFILGVVGATWVAAPALADPAYTAVRIATPTGVTTAGIALNNLGQVTGNYSWNGVTAGFATGPNGVGVTRILGPSGVFSTVYDINNAGVVVGMWSNGDGAYRAFRSTADGLDFLNMGYLGEGRSAAATAINDAGQVAGVTTIEGSGSSQQVFITDASAAALLPVHVGSTPLRYLAPNAINDSGQMAWTGVAYFGTGLAQAFLLSPVTLDDYAVTNVSPSHNYSTVASDVNDLGQVVGYSAYYSPDHGYDLRYAFISGPNGGPGGQPYMGVGFIESQAFAINDLGAMVGTRYRSPVNPGAVASLYDNGQWYDLNALAGLPGGVVLDVAYDINDLGQIVATDRNDYLWLLTPVPEPGTLACMAWGLLTIYGARFRKRSSAGRCESKSLSAWSPPSSRRVSQPA